MTGPALNGDLIEVATDAVFDGPEPDVATGIPQCCQIGLGIALVRAAQMIGERDIAKLSAAMPVDDRIGDVIEWLRLAGAAVVDTAGVWIIEKPEIDGGDVVNVGGGDVACVE